MLEEGWGRFRFNAFLDALDAKQHVFDLCLGFASGTSGNRSR